MPTGIYIRTEEHKQKIGEGQKGRILSIEHKKKLSEFRKNYYKDHICCFKDLTEMRFGRLLVIEKVGKTKSGNILWKCQCDDKNEVIVQSSNLISGKTKSCGCLHKEIISKKMKGNSWNKGIHRSEEFKKKIRGSLIGRPCSEKTRQKMRGSMLKQWASVTKEKREEWIKKVIRGSFIRPTKPEKIINGLLNELYPNEWKYVGDGSFIIDGKNPDFMNVNGKKELIELFGNHWHKPEDEIIRKFHFGNYGFKTLIVWENELKDLDLLKKKILEWEGEKTCQIS